MRPPPVHQPILLVGDSRRRQLRDRMAAAARTWYQHWAGHPPDAVTVEVSGGAVVEPAAPRQMPLRAIFGEGATLDMRLPNSLWLACLGVQQEDAADVVDAARSGSSLVGEVVRQMLEALVRACTGRQPLSMDTSGYDSPGRRSAHAAVSITALGRSMVLDCWLSPLLLSQIVPPRMVPLPALPAGARRKQLLNDKVPVTSVLGQATVPLPDFLALAPGDVLVLDQDLGEPASLTVAGKTLVARGRVGQSREKRALEITSVISGASTVG